MRHENRPTSRLVVVVVVVALLIATAAITYVLVKPDESALPAPAPLPTSSSTETSSLAPSQAPSVEAPPAPEDMPVATYDSACGLAGGSTELPSTAPEDVSWSNVDGWYFPASPSAGPGTGTSCFARTPTGAILAGYTISMLVDGLAEDFASVVTNQTVPGIGQTARLAEGASERPSTVVVPRGFVLDRYTNDEATVSYYLTTAGLDVTCSFSVQWYENDWRLRLQTNGQTPGGCIQSPPSQFTPWGP